MLKCLKTYSDANIYSIYIAVGAISLINCVYMANGPKIPIDLQIFKLDICGNWDGDCQFYTVCYAIFFIKFVRRLIYICEKTRMHLHNSN